MISAYSQILWKVLSGNPFPGSTVLDGVDEWELVTPRSELDRRIGTANMHCAYSILLLYPDSDFYSCLAELQAASLIRIRPSTLRNQFKTV